MQALGPEGFHFTYTEDISDLNSEYLREFDAIVHYGNRNDLGTEEERALLDFVASGKGFVPVHAASACFGDSDAFIELVGGRFASHETDTFSAEVVDKKHASMEGFQNFEVWDETYVHDRINPDIHVLMERVEGDHREPYTWTRQHGEGRVFYTAFGHDERAWSDRGFQDLLKRGILWAIGDETAAAWQQTPRPALSYTLPEVRLPNYEERPEEPKLQAALDPARSMQMHQVPPGFEVQLFASEPDIVNPVAMDWDEKGRLWILETLDYPNNLQPLWQGNDRIRILEDTNGDGKADSFKTFAEGLSIPTGFTFANGGVVVSAPPYMLFFKDTDGDDISDERKVLFEGFNTFDTHAGVANLRYGFDNWIWASVGYAGFNGTVGGEDHVFKQGILRFKPDGSKLEFLTRFTNNSWGLGFSETGDIFASTANNEPSVYMAIEDRYYKKVSGFDKRGSRKITPYYAMHPITEKVRQVDSFGGYTAASGHNLYTARAFPKKYWNRIAFINEPTGHLIHQAILEPKGSDFVAVDDWNLFASADEWTSPVISAVGPDGAVWFSDWYNPIIQHNPVPEGFEEGKGDAYETPHRDQQHGRIYRIVHKASKPTEWEPLSIEKPEGLLKALRSDNMLWRFHAQRLLVERGNSDVVDRMLNIVESWQEDEIGVAAPALHALGVLDGLGAVASAIENENGVFLDRLSAGLSHPSPSIVKATLKMVPRVARAWEEIKGRDLLSTQDPVLLLELLKTLSEFESSEEIGRALYSIEQREIVQDDAWLPTAIAIAASVHSSGYFTALLGNPSSFEDYESKSLSISNAGFENSVDGKPTAWDLITFTWPVTETNPNTFEFSVTNEGRSGKALHLSSDTGADFALQTKVAVKPNTDYLFTGWIKTEDVENLGGGYGAVFDIEKKGRTRAIRGTKDWTWVERQFNSGDFEEIIIGCHLGRWGQYKGKAWFDDLQLSEVTKDGSKFLIQETVLRHLATSGDQEGVNNLFASLRGAPPALSDMIIGVMSDFWPRSLDISIADEDLDILRTSISDESEFKLDQLLSGEIPSEEEERNLAEVTLDIEMGTLKFVQKEISVQAGAEFKLVVNNPDAMPHNVVFGKPDKLNSIGEAADQLLRAGNPPADYVPRFSDVLFATDLINAEETKSYTFTAPTEPGRYVFVCTYPGHWRTMNGVLIVE